MEKTFQTNSAPLSGEITNHPALNANSSTNQISKPVISKAYQPDAMLDESEHILTDYISLLTKHDALIANH